jgi:hypothetical protein
VLVRHRRRGGTVTVDGVTAILDKSLHQQGQLLFDLSKHLSRSAPKPGVHRRRKLADHLTREPLNHSAVDTAGHPVIPLKVLRAHTGELIRLELHIELVEGRVDVDDLHHLLRATRQVLAGDELLQPTAGDEGVGCRLRVRLTHGGHRKVQRRDGRLHVLILECGSHSGRGRSLSRGARGAQDGQKMVLTGLTNGDGEFGSPEPRVSQRNSAGEEGGFIRVLRISRHHAEIGAALAGRLADHLPLVRNDNGISG